MYRKPISQHPDLGPSLVYCSTHDYTYQKLAGTLRPCLNDGYLNMLIMLILKHMDWPLFIVV